MINAFNLSTNMPGIGSLIGEIAVKMSEILESKTYFRLVNPMLNAYFEVNIVSSQGTYFGP